METDPLASLWVKTGDNWNNGYFTISPSLLTRNTDYKDHKASTYLFPLKSQKQ